MKKIIALILAIPLIAASCDFLGLGLGGGTRGVFKSEDGGQTYNVTNSVPPKNNLDGLSVTAMTFDPTNTDILYIAAGRGIYKSEDAGKTWKYILAGISVADIVVDPSTTSTVYAAGIVGQTGKIIKTTDAGTSWIDIYTEPSQTNTVLSIAISRFNSSIVLAGLNNGELIRSTDAGKTWQNTNDFGHRIVKVRFNNSDNAYVLTSRSGVYKSTDKGATWAAASANLTADTFNNSYSAISSVSAFHDMSLDNRQNGTIYMGTEEGLYRTVDDGANWSRISLPLRNSALRVSTVVVDPANSNVIFATVASTIYKSTNGGVSWETKVLPTAAVIDNILINPQSSNIIYLGLRG